MSGAAVALLLAVVETSYGSFEIELYSKDAPKTVKNFTGLAKKGFFNGLRFHRVAPGYVIQSGDPLSRDRAQIARWGTGGASIYGKEFADELNPATPSGKAGYLRGVVAMANRGPNTNTSQFFILLSDAPGLPYAYTIFGRVTKGMEVVDTIGKVELERPGQQDGRPKEDVFITKVTIKK